MTEKDLSSHFSEYGEIRNLYIIYDFDTKKSRGFGFVEFKKRKDAAKALKDDHIIEGCRISLSKMKLKNDIKKDRDTNSLVTSTKESSKKLRKKKRKKKKAKKKKKNPPKGTVHYQTNHPQTSVYSSPTTFGRDYQNFPEQQEEFGYHQDFHSQRSFQNSTTSSYANSSNFMKNQFSKQIGFNPYHHPNREYNNQIQRDADPHFHLNNTNLGNHHYSQNQSGLYYPNSKKYNRINSEEGRLNPIQERLHHPVQANYQANNFSQTRREHYCNNAHGFIQQDHHEQLNYQGDNTSLAFKTNLNTNRNHSQMMPGANIYPQNNAYRNQDQPTQNHNSYPVNHQYLPNTVDNPNDAIPLSHPPQVELYSHDLYQQHNTRYSCQNSNSNMSTGFNHLSKHLEARGNFENENYQDDSYRGPFPKSFNYNNGNQHIQPNFYQSRPDSDQQGT